MINFNENDIFIVSGSTSGIGKALTIELNRLGAIVIAIGRNHDKFNNLKKSCKYPSKLVCEEKNLNEVAELDKWIVSLSRKYGKFRGAVLCAGINEIAPISSVLSLEKNQKLFDINYFSSIQIAKGFLDKRANIGHGSSLVFLSSIAAIKGNRGIVAYSASKGAINSAVKSLAIEVANLGIRVNAILPGFLESEMTNKLYSKEFIEKTNEDYPMGIGVPNDIVGPIVFLLSEQSRWITGANIVVDGGGSL